MSSPLQDSIQNEPRGAQIVTVGVSEKSLILFVLLPVGVALIAALAAVYLAASAGGAAANAVNMATLAERNAKLAQYQLDEAIKNLEKP